MIPNSSYSLKEVRAVHLVRLETRWPRWLRLVLQVQANWVVSYP